MEDASKGGGEWMSWLISQTGSSTRDGKIPKAESGAEQDVGVKWWLVQRHSCTASLGHLKPSAKIRHKPVLRWREKTVWKQRSDCFCFKIPGEINYLYLPPLIISARTDTPMAQWSSAVSWQLTRNEHVFFIFGTYLLFTHTGKYFQESFVKHIICFLVRYEAGTPYLWQQGSIIPLPKLIRSGQWL